MAETALEIGITPWNGGPLADAARLCRQAERAERLGLPYLASPIETEKALADNHAAHRETLARHGHAPDALAVPIIRSVFAHPDAAVVSRVRDALARQALALARAPSAALRRSGSAEVDDLRSSASRGTSPTKSRAIASASA